MSKGGAYPSKAPFIGQLLALLAFIKRAGSNLLGKNGAGVFRRRTFHRGTFHRGTFRRQLVSPPASFTARAKNEPFRRHI